MEPEGSSQYSQEPATCPYPEPDRSSQVSDFKFKITPIDVKPLLATDLPQFKNALIMRYGNMFHQQTRYMSFVDRVLIKSRNSSGRITYSQAEKQTLGFMSSRKE
jgi:hypothetical protein